MNASYAHSHHHISVRGGEPVDIYANYLTRHHDGHAAINLGVQTEHGIHQITLTATADVHEQLLAAYRAAVQAAKEAQGPTLDAAVLAHGEI